MRSRRQSFTERLKLQIIYSKCLSWMNSQKPRMLEALKMRVESFTFQLTENYFGWITWYPCSTQYLFAFAIQIFSQRKKIFRIKDFIAEIYAAREWKDFLVFGKHGAKAIFIEKYIRKPTFFFNRKSFA